MRQRAKVLSVLAGLAVSLAVLLLASRDREPWYEGRSYTDWLAAYDLDCRESEDPVEPQTPAYWALRDIGTKAIPTLLKWVEHEPHPLRNRLRPLVQKLPDFVAGNSYVTRLVQDPYPGARAYNTSLAFFVLGSNANYAIPALTRLMNNPSSEYDGIVAALCLAEIGPAALPPLMSAAANPQTRCRIPAVAALGQMGSNALPAVPLLVECLTGTNQTVAESAAQSLCILRLRPDIVFPILTNRLHYLSPGAREFAAEWLGEFETTRPLSRSLLLGALGDPEQYVAERATDALKKIAPEALTNAPAQVP